MPGGAPRRATFGWIDCAERGCVDPQTNNANCGGCGTTCGTSDPNGASTCVQGACEFRCNAGFVQCGAACVDPLSDVANCGACGVTCDSTNGVGRCLAGTCDPICTPGFDSCDSNGRNGCETALATDADCSACGDRCAAPTACLGGRCTTCADRGMAECGTACADLTDDPDNCGSCGLVCPGGTCVNGYCVSCSLTSTAVAGPMSASSPYGFDSVCPNTVPGAAVNFSASGVGRISPQNGDSYFQITVCEGPARGDYRDCNPSGTGIIQLPSTANGLPFAVQWNAVARPGGNVAAALAYSTCQTWPSTPCAINVDAGALLTITQ